MRAPAFILPTGTRVRTHATLGSAAGMLASGIEARQPNVAGTIAGVVPGHGGDVYWIEYRHGGCAPYCFDEFELEAT